MQSPRIWLIAVLCCACGDVSKRPPGGDDDGGDDGGDGGDDDPGEGAFTLSITTPNASVPLDGMNRVEVELERTGGFTGAVTLAGAGEPAGLTVSGATIAEGATTAEVIVAGAAPLVIGDTVSFAIEGTGSAGLTMVNVMDAPVTGRPGSLDTDFGPGTGLATISFGGDDNGAFEAMDVISGDVLAVGYGVGGLGQVQMAAMRFTAAGDVDATWNGGALVRTAFESSTGDNTRSFATGQQVDGRSIAIGVHTLGGDPGDIALVRYSLTGGGGGVDFGSDSGKGLVDLGGDEAVNDGLVLASSQIVAVGALDGHFAVARMTTTGFLDTDFATPAGFDRAVLGDSSRADSVAVDSQDRLVVAGTTVTGGQSDLVVRRYLASGDLDPDFGAAGEVMVAGADDERAAAVAVSGDLVIVAATAGSGASTSFRVRRFLATGEPDRGFGTDGLAEVVVGDAVALHMVSLPDGRIVVLGDGAGEALLARFTRRGAVDTLFGTGESGVARLFIGDAGLPGAIAVYSDHLLVISGGNQGGTPGPGTFGIVARMWM